MMPPIADTGDCLQWVGSGLTIKRRSKAGKAPAIQGKISSWAHYFCRESRNPPIRRMVPKILDV
jgi:hypothetical protein